MPCSLNTGSSLEQRVAKYFWSLRGKFSPLKGIVYRKSENTKNRDGIIQRSPTSY